MASEVGRGSTFIVTIPAGQRSLPAECIGEEKNLVSTALDTSAFVEEAMRWLPETEEEDARLKTEVSELDTESVVLRGNRQKISHLLRSRARATRTPEQ